MYTLLSVVQISGQRRSSFFALEIFSLGCFCFLGSVDFEHNIFRHKRYNESQCQGQGISSGKKRKLGKDKVT